MELTDEGYRVLEIVRRVLRERTHWATWGQTLMAAMQEKMILDYDFIPPVMSEAAPRGAAGQKK